MVLDALDVSAAGAFLATGALTSAAGAASAAGASSASVTSGAAASAGAALRADRATLVVSLTSLVSGCTAPWVSAGAARMLSAVSAVVPMVEAALPAVCSPIDPTAPV